MPKLYYPTPDELQGARPLWEGGWGYKDNHGSWFDVYQELLVRLANTDYGRDLLCIDKHPFPVKFIRKNMVTFDLSKDLGPGYKLSDVRVGAKWGNVIRSRWKYVNEALKRMAFEQMMSWPQLGARPRLAAARFTTTTVFPDPDAETTTVDGRCGRTVVNGTWADIRDGVGTVALDANADTAWVLVQSGASGNTYNQLKRGMALFDASAIGDGDDLDSTVFSIFGTGQTNGLTASLDMEIVASGPASDTAIVAGDYDLPGNWGTTRLATAITQGNWSGVAYNDFTLNASGEALVSFTALTKLGTRSNSDFDNSAHGGPTNNEDRLNGNFAEQTGTSADPKLVVVHISTFTPKVIMF